MTRRMKGHLRTDRIVVMTSLSVLPITASMHSSVTNKDTSKMLQRVQCCWDLKKSKDRAQVTEQQVRFGSISS